MCVLLSERQQHCFVNVQWIFNQNSVAGIGKKQQKQTFELIWRANVICSLFNHGLKSGIDISDFKKVLMQEQNPGEELTNEKPEVESRTILFLQMDSCETWLFQSVHPIWDDELRFLGEYSWHCPFNKFNLGPSSLLRDPF
jgi:hypothetical protein